MGECCVCGKETVQRCGSCGAAGFNLFFCSTVHQRLVWEAHKQVCGPNSNPFCSPDLSREEASLLHQVAQIPLGNPSVVEPEQLPGSFYVGLKKSTAEYLETAFYLEPGGFESLSIDAIMKLSSQRMPGSPSRQLINLYMRAFLMRASAKAGVSSDVKGILSGASFALALQCLLQAVLGPQVPSKVLQPALHHAVVFEWLTELRQRSPLPPFSDSALCNANLARSLDRLVQPLLPHFRFASESDWNRVATLFATPLQLIAADVAVVTHTYDPASGRVVRYSVEPI